MVGDQKLGRYCKIPYHISDYDDDDDDGDDGGGGRDKIGLSFFLFPVRRTYLLVLFSTIEFVLSQVFPQPSSKSGNI